MSYTPLKVSVFNVHNVFSCIPNVNWVPYTIMHVGYDVNNKKSNFIEHLNKLNLLTINHF